MSMPNTPDLPASLQRVVSPYVVIVTGWRHATKLDHHSIIADYLIQVHELADNVILRHGKCKYGGVDLIADRIARDLRWQVDEMPAEERDGRILGSPRNRAMCAKTPRADIMLAFPGPGSTGTWNCLRWGARYGIPFRGEQLAGA